LLKGINKPSYISVGTNSGSSLEVEVA